MNGTEAIMGATIMGYTVASLFFLKFWRRTGDSLFFAFSMAFLLLAATPLLTLVFSVPREEQSPFYLIRACAFIIIILAIAIKSRR